MGSHRRSWPGDPQQAIGAIWRSRRAVVVGDPIQLEPVVNIPQELVAPLQSYCGTLPKYVPPDASVQTLADRSNRYGTLMGSRGWNRHLARIALGGASSLYQPHVRDCQRHRVREPDGLWDA